MIMKLWIARERWGGLGLFVSKPIMIRNCWCTEEDDEFELNSKDFPEVTFENSPQEVELKLVND